MEEKLITDLTSELELSDENFNSNLLAIKVKNAIADVKEVRNYPDYYTDEMIENDINRYYTKIRKIALNDYNKIGIDTEKSHTENNVSMNYVDRDKLFNGVLPISRI